MDIAAMLPWWVGVMLALLSYLLLHRVASQQVVATALLDRLLHHAVVIPIEGNSYRLREHANLIPEHGTGSLTLVGGGRADPERELLWLVALVRADAPSAIELQRMFSVRKLGSLRLVGQIGDATGGADDAEPSSDR